MALAQRHKFAGVKYYHLGIRRMQGYSNGAQIPLDAIYDSVENDFCINNLDDNTRLKFSNYAIVNLKGSNQFSGNCKEFSAKIGTDHDIWKLNAIILNKQCFIGQNPFTGHFTTILRMENVENEADAVVHQRVQQQI